MPEWKEEIRRRLTGLKLEPTREAAIIEELAQHLDDQYAESLSGGATEAEACRAALAALSDSATLQRELRRLEREVAQEPIVFGTDKRRNMIADFRQDLGYAVRTLRNHSGFAAVVVLTMALGIGINTTFFTLFSLLFRPLPVKGPGAIVSGPGCGVSFLDYVYYRDHVKVFSGLIASGEAGALRLGLEGAAEEAQPISGEFVSDNFFSVLGARTVLGRAFAPEENRAPGQNPVVVLSYPFWQRQFGGDPNVVGKTLRLNAKPFVVIGVTAPDFIGLGLQKGGVKDAWLPLMMRSEVSPQDQNWLDKRDCFLALAGRIKPGRTSEEAGAEMALFWGRLHPTEKINPNARTRLRPIYIMPGPKTAWIGVAVIM